MNYYEIDKEFAIKFPDHIGTVEDFKKFLAEAVEVAYNWGVAETEAGASI